MLLGSLKVIESVRHPNSSPRQGRYPPAFPQIRFTMSDAELPASAVASLEEEVDRIDVADDDADQRHAAPLAKLRGRATSASAATLVSHLADAHPRTTKVLTTRSNQPRKLQ